MEPPLEGDAVGVVEETVEDDVPEGGVADAAVVHDFESRSWRR